MDMNKLDAILGSLKKWDEMIMFRDFEKVKKACPLCVYSEEFDAEDGDDCAPCPLHQSGNGCLYPPGGEHRYGPVEGLEKTIWRRIAYREVFGTDDDTCLELAKQMRANIAALLEE